MDDLHIRSEAKDPGDHYQRVSAAINHKAADRVPLTMGSPSCSLHKITHQNLMSYLDFTHKVDPIITDNILQIVETDQRILDTFDIDLRWLLPKPEKVTWDANQNTYTDHFGRSFKSGGGFFNQITFPLVECTNEELEQYKFPNLDNKRFEDLGSKAKDLYNDGYGIGIDGPWGLFEISSSLVGLEEYLMGLVLNPKLIIAIAERVLNEYLIPFYDLLLSETKQFVQIVGISDDLGSQTSLLFSPETYREIFKPFHKQLVDFIKSKTSAKIYMHSDGSIYPIIPDLIEIGVDGINPIQYTAKDMELDLLVTEFGSDLGFFGGIVENELLSFGSPREIKQLVEKNANILKKHHAFIFAPIHNISQEVPPENIVALYQAGLEYGKY
jgi:uroporphyrinogen decarboxylase